MGQTGMDAVEVQAVLDALDAVGCRYWVAGGWGVDALVGRQTRPHRDLDLLVDAAREPDVLRALARRGYAVETDWRPVRVEVAAPGDRWVDVHPLVLADDGSAVQAGPDGTEFVYPARCFVTGTIAGRDVACLSVEQQIAFHAGYEPREVDRVDLILLRRLKDDEPSG